MVQAVTPNCCFAIGVECFIDDDDNVFVDNDDDNQLDLFSQEERGILDIVIWRAPPADVETSSSSSWCPNNNNNNENRNNQNNHTSSNDPFKTTSPLRKTNKTHNNQYNRTLQCCGHQRRNCILQLRQYGSNDNRWGIYSTVWDGGLALLAYILQQNPCPGCHDLGNKNKPCGDSQNAHDSDGDGINIMGDAYSHWDDWTILDIGSGTGIVGLGVAAASRGRCVTAVTDLYDELLHENIALNTAHWTYGTTHVYSPVVRTLPWGEPVDEEWLSQLIVHRRDVFPVRRFTHYRQQQKEQQKQKQQQHAQSIQTQQSYQSSTTSSSSSSTSKESLEIMATKGFVHHHQYQYSSSVPTPITPDRTNNHPVPTTRPRRILITGADVVYRPSLFRPLLQTISELQGRLHRLDHNARIDCWLACNSIRTHLTDFFTLAIELGFDATILAVVELPPHHECHLERLIIHNVVIDDNDNKNNNNHENQKHTFYSSSDWTKAPVREGLVWIVQLSRRPYTLII